MKQVSFKEAMELWSKPERVVLVTSVDSDGNPHVMTVGWKMRTSFRPPMFAIAVGKQRRMHSILTTSKEYVLAVPGADLAKEVLLCGSSSTHDENRFDVCGFSKKPGNFVKAPLIQKCLASFECRVVDRIDTGDHTIFVGEVLASWINEEPARNLILIGEEAGYELLSEQGPYKIGIVRA